MRTHGILDPQAFDDRLVLERHPPAPALASFIDRHWIVRWDLRGVAPRESSTLPYPCVNLVIGTHRPNVHGPSANRFVAEIQDRGWVLGTKFKPAGFRALADRPMVEMVDADVPIPTMFGEPGAALERELLAIGAAAPGGPPPSLIALDLAAQLAKLTAFFAARVPAMDPEAATVDQIVALVESDRTITRVAELATRAKLPLRTLERMFRRHVGLSPKWVIRRFRVHEAAARVAAGEVIEWTMLAHELGYFDQAHFIREFKAQVGRTPSQHAALVMHRDR
ncbi:MAG: AraC family transcriptional regulator [Kofleriaceae bacterium]